MRRGMPPVDRPANERQALAWIVERVPELRPLLDAHIADHGEVLSYVVFEGDFLRWFIDRVRQGDHEPARRFAASIEPLMTTGVEPPANDSIWNLASVAFVEGLVMQGDADDVIATARPWMGPNTSSDIDEMLRHRTGG